MTFKEEAERRRRETFEKAPEQVKQVYNKMVENAKEAEELDDSVYLGYHPPQDWQKEPHESWSIGDNYERVGINLVYRADLDKWFYRNTWDGEDSPMPGGFDEAMGNASCMYTG